MGVANRLACLAAALLGACSADQGDDRANRDADPTASDASRLESDAAACTATGCADACAVCTADSGPVGITGVRNDWPCTGCITTIPDSYSPTSPIPVLISLHGDEGSPSVSHGFWSQAALDGGYLLLSPKCPTDLGCSGSWGTGSWHPGGNQGSIDWVLAQLDAVEVEYNVDPDRIFLTGGSGGAVYVGYHAAAFSPRVAGFSMVSGGWSSISATCSPCPPLPVYVLVGDQDYLLDLARKARDWYQGCGDDVVYDEMPGVDHQGGGESLTTGKGDAILTFFTDRPNSCLP